MSLFGSLLGGGGIVEMEDDPFFGSHMRTMRHMNNMMNSLFADPFGAMGMLGGPMQQMQPAIGFPSSPLNPMTSLMPFGAYGGALASPMPHYNPLINLGGAGGSNGSFHSSSTVVSMSSGPDGRPHVYKSTMSTRCAPGGIRETQRTESDSLSGTKKMSIGHHIGDRAHIIEREQNVRNGDHEERQDFINLDEDDADDFNQEWVDKTRSTPTGSRSAAAITNGTQRSRHSAAAHGAPLAITAGPSSRRSLHSRERYHVSPMSGVAPVHPVQSRRSIRASPLTLPPQNISPSSTRSPYAHPHHYPPSSGRKQKHMKTVSNNPPTD